MESLVFSTNNEHKLSEIRSVLQNKYRIYSLQDIGIDYDIPETGITLEENALIKARYIWNEKGINCFSDDTGLEVEVLNGDPGVYSARYAGEQKNSADNVARLLKELNGKTNRNASFRTVIAAIVNGKEYLFEGQIDGEIIQTPKGDSGFGYDPVFIPNGYDKTFAEMTDDEKNGISHRAMAVRKLADFLEKK
ncbi:MAG: non-canonical purine NTP diphosphatase [Dysgonomonas sp.]